MTDKESNAIHHALAAVSATLRRSTLSFPALLYSASPARSVLPILPQRLRSPPVDLISHRLPGPGPGPGQAA
eukprot:766534-Hanusia_phi.AAC.1